MYSNEGIFNAKKNTSIYAQCNPKEEVIFEKERKNLIYDHVSPSKETKNLYVAAPR